jgi:hypothetical protein
MPFVRHELGTRLRLRRIPDLHVRPDETIERGTRVLHLLEELEAGRVPTEAEIADMETLPTPVVRLRHEGDLADEPPPAAEPPPPARRRRTRRPATKGASGDAGQRERGSRHGKPKR